MTTKTTERENLIAEFKKEFFANVKIESRTKNLYLMSNHAGHIERIWIDELLNQNKTRITLLELNDKMMPDMNKSEYLGFVQNVRDNTFINEKW